MELGAYSFYVLYNEKKAGHKCALWDFYFFFAALVSKPEAPSPSEETFLKPCLTLNIVLLLEVQYKILMAGFA